MLSRHIVRSKTLQAIYSHVVGGESDIAKSGKALLSSVEDMRDLAHLQIYALLELHRIAERKIEENKNKLMPSEEDLNPNLTFVNNPMLLHLNENQNLKIEFASLKVNWSEMEDIFRKIYKEIQNWADYKKYMLESEHTFDSHRQFVAKLFKRYIAFDQNLRDFFEEKNIHWSIDTYLTGVMVHAWLKKYDPENPDSLKFPKMLKDSEGLGDDDDKTFMLKLFDKTILNFNKYDEIIEKHLKNWELDRIITIDILIIKMALTEIIYFENIPIKASLNEYIELSKEFGSSKSNSFVNGLLDKIIQELKSEKKIVKIGRGLE